jgi:isocitrate lyase
MKALTRLDEYLETAPMKVKIALAAAGTFMAAVIASQTMPETRAAELNPARTAPIVQQQTSKLVSGTAEYNLAIERMRPMPEMGVESIDTITSMNERTSDMLRDMNEIATRLHQSKAWSGDTFTPEQKAKNIANAFVYAQMRADHPDLKKIDGYLVKIREDVPDNRLVNNVIGDLNFKRQILREATLELGALTEAVKDNQAEKVEFHRQAMEVILKDAGYALNEATDWSVKAGREMTR